MITTRNTALSRTNRSARHHSAGQRHRAILEALESRVMLSLLGLHSPDIDYPVISINGISGELAYTATPSSTDGHLHVFANPTSAKLKTSSTQFVIINDPKLTIDVDLSSGALVNPVGNFTLTGDVIVNGNPYTGTLLTGTATGFGFEFAGYNADNFDFRFEGVTGALATAFSPKFNGGAYISVFAENAYLNSDPAQHLDYVGATFSDTSFNATPKATLSAIPGASNLPPGLRIVKNASDTTVGAYQPVTYTYTVTNTGGVPFAGADINLIDDNGTPNFAGDDFHPTLNVSSDTGSDFVLSAGEVWTYSATVIPPVILQTVNSDTGQVIPAGAVIITEDVGVGYKVTYLQDFGINDNTYGTGAVGWKNGHTFGNLTGSDKLEFRIFDNFGNVVMDLYIDCITQALTGKLANGDVIYDYPAGYGTLGPFGGDGFMVSGDPQYVIGYSTSITDNLNNPANLSFKSSLIVNSPTVLITDPNDPRYDLNPDHVWIDPAKAPGGWEYINTYSVTISKDAFADGAVLGAVAIPDQHNSPAKQKILPPAPVDNLITNEATVTATATVGGTPVTITAGPSRATVYILTTPGSLSGSVYVDANGNGTRDSGEVGIGGVPVTLTGIGSIKLVDLTLVDLPAYNVTVTTAPDGTYTFTNLARSTGADAFHKYTITEGTVPVIYGDGTDKAGNAGGNISVQNVISAITLSAGFNATGYTFGETLADQSSLAGVVFNDSNNNGDRDTQNVTASAAADTLTVPADGRTYVAGDIVSFSNSGGTLPAGLVAGTVYYVVSPTNGGHTFKVSLTRGGGAINLTNNGSGTNSVTDAGLAGVTVKLYKGSDVIATTTTAPGGGYSFTGLLPETYKIVESQPAGYLDGIDTVGSLSSSTATSDIFTVTIPLAGNAAGTDYNFGELLLSAGATSSVSKAFSSTAIAPGNTIWFSSIVKVGGLNNTGSGPVHLRVVNAFITLTTKTGQVYPIPVPDALITFTNGLGVNQGTTTFEEGIWKTEVDKTTSGNIFLSAIPWVVPAGVTNLAGATMKWTATFLDDSAAIDVTAWAGAAAVYNTTTIATGASQVYTFPTDGNGDLDLTQLNIKPTDVASADYSNTDKAGTMESVVGVPTIKSLLIAGALGTGGTNYTGGYTANGNPTDLNVISDLVSSDPTETFEVSPVDVLSLP